MKGRFGNQGFIRGFLMLVVIVAFLFVGLKFTGPYYRSYSVGSHTRDYLRLLTTTNVEAIKRNVIELANESGVLLNGRSVVVTYDINSKTVRVRAEWS
jgi:hypothetical protein